MDVPPSVDNIHAQAILDATAEVTGPPMVRIARAAKRTKQADAMLQIGAITEEEFGEHLAFEAAVTANAIGDAANSVLGPPAWFGPAIGAALAPVNTRLDNIENRLDNIDNRLHNIEARQNNTVGNENMDALQPLLNADGVEFPTFPRNFQELHALTGQQMTAFLDHYGLHSGDDNAEKLRCIKKFIGMRIA